jgi:hypothetical protein
MLVLARKAAEPGEASMKSTTIQKSFNGSDHDRSGPVLGSEPFLVGVDVVVKCCSSKR